MYKEKLEICLMDRDAIKRERERERNLQVYRDKSPEIEREIIMCRERYLQG